MRKASRAERFRVFNYESRHERIRGLNDGKNRIGQFIERKEIRCAFERIGFAGDAETNRNEIDFEEKRIGAEKEMKFVNKRGERWPIAFMTKERCSNRRSAV